MKVLALALFLGNCASSEARYYLNSGLAVEKFDGYFADDPSYFDGKTGVSQGFEKTIDWGRDEEDNYSLTYKGYFKVPASSAGTSSVFEILSDDASFLWIGDKDQSVNALEASINTGNAKINHGGLHGMDVSGSASLALTAGEYYPIIIYYGESTVGEALKFRFGTAAGLTTNGDSVLYTEDYDYVPPAPAPVPEGGGSCFHGSGLMLLEGGATRAMKELRVGDRVLSANSVGNVSFSEVLSLPHDANTELSVFLTLTTEMGKAVDVTPDHLLPKCSGELVTARSFTVGDCLLTVDGEEALHGIVMSRKEGVYTAVTENTYVVVNQIIASPFGVDRDTERGYQRRSRAESRKRERMLLRRGAA